MGCRRSRNMSGCSARGVISTTVYGPWATLSLVDELLLDFSIEADELPIEVEDALEAEEVLSAIAGSVAQPSASALNKGRAVFKNGCITVLQWVG